ncbi:uncharacterized protein [Mobula birostris]|uniref:uncharacterized protein isoform X1 n=1 Tax=Mobula birostris TaxID=1983395 RepID=UPI003B27D94B
MMEMTQQCCCDKAMWRCLGNRCCGDAGHQRQQCSPGNGCQGDGAKRDGKGLGPLRRGMLLRLSPAGGAAQPGLAGEACGPLDREARLPTDCFTSNKISGRKLIFVNCSTLPSIGITDFEHMKVISHEIHKLLDIEEPAWNRSISHRHRDPMGLFLERKAPTGPKAAALTLEEFLKQLDA